METYIEMKIKAFLEKSNPERYIAQLANGNLEIRRMWKSEQDNTHVNWRRINNNQDVIDLIDRFDREVESVEDNVQFGDGHIEDAYHMALEEYKALQGLRKLAKFITPSPFNNSAFTKLSDSEIDELFERMDKIVERMNIQNQRRAMQD